MAIKTYIILLFVETPCKFVTAVINIVYCIIYIILLFGSPYACHISIFAVVTY